MSLVGFFSVTIRNHFPSTAGGGGYETGLAQEFQNTPDRACFKLTNTETVKIRLDRSQTGCGWQYHFIRMSDMSPPPGQVPDLVARAAAGDREAIDELLGRYRTRLRRMVALRLDPRLQGRVDASDVIQDGYLDAMKRLEEYILDPSVSFYVWLRFLVGQRVAEYHRRYLGRPGRNVGREISINRGVMPGASTGALAARLLGKLTSPSRAAMQAERKLQLQEALNRMDPLDREILVLRHYEQMSNIDAAAALGLERAAASKRYTRALERLEKILANLPGGVNGDVS